MNREEYHLTPEISEVGSMIDRLPREFYETDGLTLAQALIGKVLVHRVNGVELCGIISETEAYMGVTDKASHAYGGRRTKRTETMYLHGGFAYVYRIYGIYSCMNITANVAGNAEAVLIRAVMPCGGEEHILRNFRASSRRKNLPDDISQITQAELFKLTNGPGKLCLAMAIGAAENRADMLSEDLFVRDDGWRAETIIRSPRIGIDYAGEAAEYPWRFTAGENRKLPVFVK